MFEFPTTRPTRSRVVRSTTDSGALPKTVEIPTISRSREFIRTSIAKQSSGSAFPPLHAASVSIHTRDGRSTCGPPRTSGNGRSSGSPVRQFRTGPMHVSGSRAAATSNSETPLGRTPYDLAPSRLRIYRPARNDRQSEREGRVEIPAVPRRRCGTIILRAALLSEGYTHRRTRAL